MSDKFVFDTATNTLSLYDNILMLSTGAKTANES